MTQQCEHQERSSSFTCWMGRSASAAGAVVVVVILAAALVVGVDAIRTRSDPVDWSDWHERKPRGERVDLTANVAGVDTSPASGVKLVVSRARPRGVVDFEGDKYSLVEECPRRLELPGASCEGEEPLKDSYRIPFMQSGDLPCGFESRMTDGALQDLASTYAFHFVGDSTTRRLAESFVSIATGRASPHAYFHSNKDLSSGSVKVIFYWAPFCSAREDQPGIGDAITAILEELDQRNQRGQIMRKVIVTAFGVWDGTHGGDLSAALSNCTDVMQEVVEGAPVFSVAGEAVADSPLPPLVFLLQNNPYSPTSRADRFLTMVHQMQRDVVEEYREGGTQGGVFLVDDRESLYRRIPCYRRNQEIHFLDPVKLIEGKMLWDLVALAGGRRS